MVLGAPVNARVDRLRERLDGLLVTNGVNVVYLSGFESSNAALLVDQEHVRLFSDFRYREAAGQVAGVEYTSCRATSTPGWRRSSPAGSASRRAASRTRSTRRWPSRRPSSCRAPGSSRSCGP